MRTLEVKRISAPVQADAVGRILDASGVKWHHIDNVNWPEEYPFQPVADFRIAHTGDSILLQYRVEEPTVRAVAATDNGRVWEDSCVEFFVENPAGEGYINVECNCAGNILMACGPDRDHRTTFAVERLGAISRQATLGREPFDEKAAPEFWEVSLKIPAELLCISNLSGKQLRANFYKCGDLLSTPHFLSWNSFDTHNPDFHRQKNL
ncbi:MAG: hypothetical protein K2M12_10005, partial [Muribaculaceae bacterium]|nr:hypothetical protein [Muribaculaceae bacterium]